MAKKVELEGRMSWDNSRLKRGLKEAEGLSRKSAGNIKAAFAAVGAADLCRGHRSDGEGGGGCRRPHPQI